MDFGTKIALAYKFEMDQRKSHANHYRYGRYIYRTWRACPDDKNIFHYDIWKVKFPGVIIATGASHKGEKVAEKNANIRCKKWMGEPLKGGKAAATRNTWGMKPKKCDDKECECVYECLCDGSWICSHCDKDYIASAYPW